MKQIPNGLARQYVTALRKHLRRGARIGLRPAVRLGRRAVSFGLETLELARIHEGALVTLNISPSKDGVRKRAEVFFSEAIKPIVATHSAARQSEADLHRLNVTLHRRTAELAATNRLLQRGIARHKGVEAALKKSGKKSSKLLKGSRQLQQGLRQLTHRVLTAQEAERHKLSRELQDEVAQTLLGINVRLVSLKSEARSNTRSLKNEIASTQRIVEESVQSINRFARELDVHQPV